MSSTNNKKQPKVYIKTFGCQMNKADSRRLEEIFISKGYDVADIVRDADVIVFNTCSVREHAEQKAMSNIGKLKFLKQNTPEVKICVVGCMAQRMQKEIINNLPHVDFVVGPSTMFDLPDIIKENNAGVHVNNEKNVKEYYEDLCDIVDKKREFSGYIPIMRGCNNYCSYCIVPFVRGNEKYREKTDIINECRQYVVKGINEIMLLGQSVNSHPEFKEILESVSKLKGIKRVRFVTSYPGKIDKELIDIVAESPVLCNYFHLPIQSGSDTILNKMNRKYTVSDYIKTAEYIREKIPHVSISSDFIVGFPGETEEDFHETLDVVRKVEFDLCFTFKYSPRPLTEASRWDDDVPLEIKKDRLSRLNEVCTSVALKRNRALEGEVLEVFAEDSLNGRSDNYKIVFWNGEPAEPGESVRVKITQALPHSLKGERI